MQNCQEVSVVGEGEDGAVGRESLLSMDLIIGNDLFLIKYADIHDVIVDDLLVAAGVYEPVLFAVD